MRRQPRHLPGQLQIPPVAGRAAKRSRVRDAAWEVGSRRDPMRACIAGWPTLPFAGACRRHALAAAAPQQRGWATPCRTPVFTQAAHRRFGPARNGKTYSGFGLAAGTSGLAAGPQAAGGSAERSGGKSGCCRGTGSPPTGRRASAAASPLAAPRTGQPPSGSRVSGGVVLYRFRARDPAETRVAALC